MSRTRTSIQKLNNQILKPLGVSTSGIVAFTQNGTDAVQANRETCEAYGYFYDETSSTCYAYKNNINLVKDERKQSNKVSGSANTIIN